MRPTVSKLGRTLLHWLLPQTCAHCRGDMPRDYPEPLCAPCRRALVPAEAPLCARCGMRVGPERTHCPPCGRRLFSCRIVRAAFEYRGPAVSLVHAFKFRGRRDAAAAGGREMAAALARTPELAGGDGLVPVPLHRGRLRERGYNQALMLAEVVAAASGLPVLEALSRRRATRPLWKLGRRGRGKHLAGAFSATETVLGRRLLLIDDVATTTQTLEECAKALQEAGAAEVRALVLARRGVRATAAPAVSSTRELPASPAPLRGRAGLHPPEERRWAP